MGYYLTYHGVNDEEFRRKIGYMHAYAYPHLVARAGHVSSPALTAASEATHTKEEYYRAATALMHDPPHLPRKCVAGDAEGVDCIAV